MLTICPPRFGDEDAERPSSYVVFDDPKTIPMRCVFPAGATPDLGFFSVQLRYNVSLGVRPY